MVWIIRNNKDHPVPTPFHGLRQLPLDQDDPIPIHPGHICSQLAMLCSLNVTIISEPKPVYKSLSSFGNARCIKTESTASGKQNESPFSSFPSYLQILYLLHHRSAWSFTITSLLDFILYFSLLPFVSGASQTFIQLHSRAPNSHYKMFVKTVQTSALFFSTKITSLCS